MSVVVQNTNDRVVSWSLFQILLRLNRGGGGCPNFQPLLSLALHWVLKKNTCNAEEEWGPGGSIPIFSHRLDIISRQKVNGGSALLWFDGYQALMMGGEVEVVEEKKWRA